jgi:hypothetical protein
MPFQIYSREGLSLLISGVGAKRAAAGVNYAASLSSGESPSGWINVGVGGHAEYSLGLPVLASRILDRSSGQKWLPQLTFESDLRSGPVVTVEEPESDYPGDAVYEMEASGFFAEAVKHTTTDLVHVLKIVSDNSSRSVRLVTASIVEELVTANLKAIEWLVESTLSMVQARLEQSSTQSEVL